MLGRFSQTGHGFLPLQLLHFFLFPVFSNSEEQIAQMPLFIWISSYFSNPPFWIISLPSTRREMSSNIMNPC